MIFWALIYRFKIPQIGEFRAPSCFFILRKFFKKIECPRQKALKYAWAQECQGLFLEMNSAYSQGAPLCMLGQATYILYIIYSQLLKEVNSTQT